jgi:hypothetical protein
MHGVLLCMNRNKNNKMNLNFEEGKSFIIRQTLYDFILNIDVFDYKNVRRIYFYQ